MQPAIVEPVSTVMDPTRDLEVETTVKPLGKFTSVSSYAPASTEEVTTERVGRTQNTDAARETKYTKNSTSFFKRIKMALGVGKSERQKVKRRRGMYTFLYGGRVNVNTFYDYKDV